MSNVKESHSKCITCGISTIEGTLIVESTNCQVVIEDMIWNCEVFFFGSTFNGTRIQLSSNSGDICTFTFIFTKQSTGWQLNEMATQSVMSDGLIKLMVLAHHKSTVFMSLAPLHPNRDCSTSPQIKEHFVLACGFILHKIYYNGGQLWQTIASYDWNLLDRTKQRRSLVNSLQHWFLLDFTVLVFVNLTDLDDLPVPIEERRPSFSAIDLSAQLSKDVYTVVSLFLG